MRRKPGTLLPIEVDILAAGIDLARAGEAAFHGFQLAKQLADQAGARKLTAHGTLYKALDRLADAGLLTRTWEDPEAAAALGRPRRRLYQVTGAGERALAAAPVSRASRAHTTPGEPGRPGLEPA
jgi:DNA-binding PadR family transcriptional regulator